MAFPLAAILGGVSLAGKLFGGGAKASADSRRGDALLQAQLNAQNQRNQLDTAGFNLKAPSILGQRMIGSGGLLNYTPRGTTGGAAGFAKSLQDPQTRAALMSMMQGASGQLQSGSYRQKPILSSLPKSGFMEKAGGILGTVGGISEALLPFIRGNGASSPGGNTMGYGGF